MRGFRILAALSILAPTVVAGSALAQTTILPAPVVPTATNTPTTLPQPSAQALQPVPAAAPVTTTTTVTTPAVTSTQTTTSATTSATTTTPPETTTSVTPASPVLTKEQQNQAAVQAILGGQVRKVAPPVPSVMTSSDLLARGVIVTPQAKEVVIVKRGAPASSERAIYSAADRAFSEGQYATAVELYDRMLQRSPSNKTALYGKALSLHKSGRTDEALLIYERLSLLDPTNVNATANYMSLLRQKDPQRALSRLQNLEQQNPNRPSLQGQIGMVYADMNDTPDAVRAFSRAIALDPGNAVYPFNLGVLYDRLGNDKKAAENYRAALDIAGNDPAKVKNIPMDTIRDRLKDLNY
jgi:Flp pilus assembly protein TadD